MKLLIIGLLFPLFTIGQTIHHNGEKIIYKGSVKLDANALTEIRDRLQLVLPEVAGKMTDSILIQSTEDELQALGSIRLQSPYHIIKKVHFTMLLKPSVRGYDYSVDSIYVTEKRRGWKEKKTQSEELIEALEETGNAAVELEILLNEIDLRIQKLLTVLENQMKTKKPGREQNNTASAGNRTSQ